MIFEFVKTHQYEFPVVKMTCVLGFSRSHYYRRIREPLSKQEQADQALLAEIERVFCESGETYGSPRVYEELHDAGVSCGKNRIERLMKDNGLIANAARKYKAQRIRIIRQLFTLLSDSETRKRIPAKTT